MENLIKSLQLNLLYIHAEHMSKFVTAWLQRQYVVNIVPLGCDTVYTHG
jgi:hypothetical protein